jgi:hypothetical protein
MGVRKVWQQLRREGKDVGAMAQLARLMRAVGLPTSVLPRSKRREREGIAPRNRGLQEQGCKTTVNGAGSGNSLKFPAPRPQIPCFNLLGNFAASD